MTEGRTRRGFLRGCAASGSLALAGCSAPGGSAEFASAATGYRERSVVAGGPTPESGPPVFAAVITDAAAARDRLNTDALPETYAADWVGLDYSSVFVAAFVSRYRVTPPGVADGDCPLGRPEGETFTFSLGFDEWPPATDGRLFTALEKWRLDGRSPPERATVEVAFGGDGVAHGCSD